MSKTLRAALGGTILAGSCLLAACNQSGAGAANQMMANSATPLPALPASLPMQSEPAAPAVVAPQVSALPRAPRPALRRLADPGEGYAYLDRAASYDDAIGQAPPDYAFNYGGVNPWGWQADDGSVEYAEPIDGGYRYYYYQPGADTPYLVRDPYYSYAYDGPALVLIYDRGGRPLPPDAYGPRWDYAGRYFARAQALRAAAQADRRGVIAANWAARRAEIAASNAAWDAARARDAAWAAFHAQSSERQNDHWQAERNARAQAAQRFAAYQEGGFQGPPPVLGRDPRQPDRGGPQQQRVNLPPTANRAPLPAAAMPQQPAREPFNQARMVQQAHDQQAGAQRVQREQAHAAKRQAAPARAQAPVAPPQQRAQAERNQHAAAREQDVAVHEQQRSTPTRPAAQARPAPGAAAHPDEAHRPPANAGAAQHGTQPHGMPAPNEHPAPQPHAAPVDHSASPKPAARPHEERSTQPAPAPHLDRPSAPRPAAPPQEAPPGGAHEHEHH